MCVTYWRLRHMAASLPVPLPCTRLTSLRQMRAGANNTCTRLSRPPPCTQRCAPPGPPPGARACAHGMRTRTRAHTDVWPHRFGELREAMLRAHERQLQGRPHLRLDTEAHSPKANLERLLRYIAED